MTSLAEKKLDPDVQRVLNVGGNCKETTPFPPHYDSWKHEILDIDPEVNPDIVCDARDMLSLPAGVYDSVYCSHNLEHFYTHEIKNILECFKHVLKPNGFVEVYVPDILAVIRQVASSGMDLDDNLYDSTSGPMTPRDVLYGWGKQIEESGQDFYAHKTGFSSKLLKKALKEVGFKYFLNINRSLNGIETIFEIGCVGFVDYPTKEQQLFFGFKL